MAEIGTKEERVGFIGLGRMGRGMAANILKSGVDLVVYDVNPDASAALAAHGARVAGSVAELAAEADVIFTSLPGPAQVEDVLIGPNGIAPHAREGTTVFEMSTSAHALALRVHDELAKYGVGMLDAPISGGPEGAESGQLAIWVGGEEPAYQANLHLLTAMGDKVRHVGPMGSGTVIKLVHNLSACMIMHCLAETFSVGVKGGIDPLILWESLKLGVVGKQSPLDMIKGRFMVGQFEPGLTLDLSYKDLKLAAELARDLGVPTRMADLTVAENVEALANGLAKEDAQAFLKLQLERAQVTIAVDPQDMAAAGA